VSASQVARILEDLRRAFPDPPGYETQRRILAGLSVAQREWELSTGARLECLPTAPYFRYSREQVPKPPRTGETVSEKPIRDGDERVVGWLLIRDLPDGTRQETMYDLEEREL
jgi:hypothetical protein